jgi:PAS domain S-box-containing protein
LVILDEGFKKHFWVFVIGFIGFFIVGGYLVFEYFIIGEDLSDIPMHPLEHIIIFAIVPLSIALGYAFDRTVQSDKKRLREKSHTELIINSICEGLVELNRDFKVLSVNNFILDLLKMESDEIVGKNCYEVFHGFQEVCGDCPVKVTFDTGEPSSAVQEGKAKDGTKTYVEMSSYPIKNSKGKVTSVIEIVKDVSERKKHMTVMKEKQALEKMSKITVNRELRMVELKKEVDTLKKRLKKYESS